MTKEKDMARKQKVVIDRTKMDSMLDYLEIGQGSTKDERLSKRDLKNLLDQITSAYERQIVEDVVQKLKDKMQEDMDNEDDGMMGDFDEASDDFDHQDKLPNIFDNPPDEDFNPEIEKFLAWVSAVLYSGDHKIEISHKGNKTHIVFIKLDPNGRK